MNFKIGDLFQICEYGFDFVKEIEKEKYSSSIVTSSYFENNGLKYVEIVNSIKHGKRTKYKIKLFFRDKDIWHSYSCPEELFKWVYPRVLKDKLEVGAIWSITWVDIAKETLIEFSKEEGVCMKYIEKEH